MDQSVTIEIQVEEATAAALEDPNRRAAIGALVDRLVRPRDNDPLLALLEKLETQARDVGLTAHEIETELAARKAERRG